MSSQTEGQPAWPYAIDRSLVRLMDTISSGAAWMAQRSGFVA